MLTRILFLICCPMALLMGAGDFSVEPAGGWVKETECNLGPAAVKASQENLQYFLIDEQRNFEEKSTYFRYVVKAVSQAGISEISQIKIGFEPSYQRVALHEIRVLRNGSWSDRLHTSRHQLIQKEEELDQGIYSGSMTLVYFLDDIRVDDVIEYSYSVIGENPLLNSHYTEMLYLQHGTVVEKLSYRFVSHRDHAFQAHAMHTKIAPKIRDLSPSQREWVWEVSQAAAYAKEADQPDWHSARGFVQMSDYGSWEEVAAEEAPLYDLPEELSAYPDAMLQKAGEWMERTKDPLERALLAVRFVQDEVRYLGFEEGVHGRKPHDPREVFKKRFGDCKDKTLLLRALLNIMDIRSTPTLVHSNKGKRLEKMIPSPDLFNHVVLRIEIDGSNYWVDSTINLQGGSLENNYFPDYSYGLLLCRMAPGLIELPSYHAKRPTELHTTISVESTDEVTMKTVVTFYDDEADYVRRYVGSVGLEEISQDHLNDAQAKYGDAELVYPTTSVDDREKNIYKITQTFSVPTQDFTQGKIFELYSSTVEDFHDDQVNPSRRSPYSLAYPLWVKEHIHVDNSFMKWIPRSSSKIFQNESISFLYSHKIENHTADFHYELKHTKDHIPKSALKEYWNISKNIEKLTSYELPIIQWEIKSANEK
ncbi:MAG: DUF3857 and transglutaminase domain-containing protein [Chlamydiales bacterium]|nr:DUF3857 and transglutaminase domain-containing protein [Chlamydiales bacterium]